MNNPQYIKSTNLLYLYKITLPRTKEHNINDLMKNLPKIRTGNNLYSDESHTAVMSFLTDDEVIILKLKFSKLIIYKINTIEPINTENDDNNDWYRMTIILYQNKYL